MSWLDRLFGRPEVVPPRPPASAALVKAASGMGVVHLSDEPKLGSLYGDAPQKRMARYLKAYRYGWFYKAESVISFDFSTVPYHLDDINGKLIESPDLDIPFADLDPIGQLQRLLERPNPQQTRRQLWEKSQIRADMAGNTFLYLDSPDLSYGLPQAIWGISPARMWPSYDKQGNIIGWVMDYDKGTGRAVPFEPEEIIHYAYGSPDDDIWGVGVVEASEADAQVQIGIGRYSSDTLSMGGRLAGMLWPKDRALEESEYLELVRSWRSIANDPNAAKRLLITPEPMEWQKTSATPQEIGLKDLAELNRDAILTAFPISYARLGGALPAGLNAGDARKWDEQDYQRHTLHPRYEGWREMLQVNLIARYEKAANTTLALVIDEQITDDRMPAFDLAQKAENQPLTLDERRNLLNLPPLGPQNGGNVIWLPATVVPTGTPVLPEPELKAVVIPLNPGKRGRIVAPLHRLAQDRLRTFLEEQRERILKLIEERLTGPKAQRITMVKADDWWWDPELEDEALRQALRESIYVRLVAGTWSLAGQTIANEPTGTQEALVDQLIKDSGTRITQINEATRQAIADSLSTGVSRGYSVTQIANGVPAENYGGFRELQLENGGPAWDNLRAETIARTETAQAYNQAAVGSWGAYGVTELQAIDGDGDEECAARDGRIFSVEEAMDISDHPNGTLDWVPVQPEFVRAMPVKAAPSLPASPAPPITGLVETLAQRYAEEEAQRAKRDEIASSQLTEIITAMKSLAERPITVLPAEVLPPDLTPLAEAIQRMETSLSRPKRVVRDGDRIVGIE